MAQTADFGLNLSARVVGDQARDLTIYPGTTQVAGAIERVKTRLDERRGIPNVM
jgi:hypothetical protein